MTSTDAFASDVPLIVGVVSLVELLFAGTWITGGAGSVTSTVNTTGQLAGDDVARRVRRHGRGGVLGLASAAWSG